MLSQKVIFLPWLACALQGASARKREGGWEVGEPATF